MASKFDNRLQEFGERWEVDKYLSATGYLPGHVRPFFVALPKVRALLLLRCERAVWVGVCLFVLACTCSNCRSA